MSARSFRSLFMVASCAGAALGCYLVSLRVASERAALENVEMQIVVAQRDLRVLQTEIGTRGRLSQLERWNAGVFALSAPSADQFLQGSFELARLTQPERKVDFQAPVVLASAPAPQPQNSAVGEAATDDSGAPAAVSAGALLHDASLNIRTREVPARPVAALPQATVQKSTGKPVSAAKPALTKTVDKPGLAAAQTTRKGGAAASSAQADAAPQKTVDKPAAAAARPVTKPVRLAKIDPLAPLPAKHPARTKDSTADR